ncbi:hypothetical protein KM043_001096 [Ampulex compressa]|nr:hypothetical protein KM043_001096 [Ampulex compressa]
MVRTKAERVQTKVVGSKAPHKVGRSTPTRKVAPAIKGEGNSGGNSYHPRETPNWQKPITRFLSQNAQSNADGASGSQDNEYKVEADSREEDEAD